MSEEEKAVEEENNDFVSKEKFEELAKENQKLADNYNAMLGRYKKVESQLGELSNEKHKLAEIANEKTNSESSLNEQFAQLQQEVKQMREREENVKRGAARSKLLNELIKNDAEEELAELAVDSILANNAKKIRTTQTTNGNYDVAIEDLVGEHIPVSDFIKSYMETNAGKKLQKSKKAPKAGILNGQARGTTQISSLEFSKLSPEQQNSGNYELISS